MSDRDELLSIVRAARTRIELEGRAGLDALPLQIRPYRPAPPPAPKKSDGPPAWPKEGVRPSQNPDKMPEELSEAAADKFDRLVGIEEEMGDCTRCKLAYNRTCLVFGVGNPGADVMFVGEGPGYEEDLSGEAFVGRAGKMLTDIIQNVLHLRRRDVYIANIVKCRPPKNRNPQPDEVAACSPFLERQIETIQPRILVALGGPAAKWLLETQVGITRLRGKFVEKYGALVMPTFHPAYLLRSPQEKRKTWEDMIKVRDMLAQIRESS